MKDLASSTASTKRLKMTETVKFNVGGQKYEVSKSQLDLYPNTMLGRIISEQWLDDTEGEIFIDRNGNLFQYVLDYIRDGKVCLPFNLSKQGFINELEYFGFQDIDKSQINFGTSQESLAMSAYKASYKVLKGVSREAYAEARRAEILGDCVYIAGLLIDHYVDNGQHAKEFKFTVRNNSTWNELYLKLCNISDESSNKNVKLDDSVKIQKINDYLHKVGLLINALPVWKTDQKKPEFLCELHRFAK